MYKRNGKFYVDFLYEGRRYVKGLRTGNKSVAKEIEMKFRSDVMTGKYAEKQEKKKRDALFTDVLDDYLTRERINKKSHKRDETTAVHLNAFLKGKKILEITPDDILDYK